MDCNTARLFFPFRRPGELDGPEADELNLHLAQCNECNALASGDRRLDQHLGRAMRDVAVPAGLRGEILHRLAAERGDWYLRWFGHAARGAVAAVLLLALGAGALWWFNRPPTRLQADQVVSNFIASPPGDASAADAALHRLGGQGAPTFVNYAYLTGVPALAVLPGYENVKAPEFVFTRGPHRDDRGGDRVVVFAIDQRQFKIDEAESYSDGDKYHFELFRESEKAPFAYLVFYTGDNWEWLKAQPSAAE